MKVCIIGASGKLGQYMVQHALDRGYEVVGVCRSQSVQKLSRFGDRITVHPGQTDDREVVARAVKGCDAVLTVLVPWGMQRYASGTAQAVLDLAEPHARLVFSCGWHISRDGKDQYSLGLRALVKFGGWFGRLTRLADLDDQVDATNRIFESDRAWTVVRGSDLEEGPSEGLPVWAQHVGDPILASNLTRRVDFAAFMVDAITNDSLIREAPAIVGCKSPSALRAARQDPTQVDAPDARLPSDSSLHGTRADNVHRDGEATPSNNDSLRHRPFGPARLTTLISMTKFN